MPVVWVTGTSTAQASYPDTLCRLGPVTALPQRRANIPLDERRPAFTTRSPRRGPSRPAYVCLWILPDEGPELPAGLSRDRTDTSPAPGERMICAPSFSEEPPCRMEEAPTLSLLQTTVCSEDGDVESGARIHPMDSGTFPHPCLSRSPVTSHSNAQKEHLCPKGFQRDLLSSNSERCHVDRFVLRLGETQTRSVHPDGRVKSQGLRGLPC